MEKKNRLLKKIAILLAICILNQALLPGIASALTNGPSQPEMEQFEPAGTSDMVNLFTGDFTYNLPLCEVDGYPLNLAYHSGPNMDQEASWVGLGWTLNPGVINRQLRGLPDDFRGDLVKREFNIKENITVGINGFVGLEFVGSRIPKIGLNVGGGIFYNNYRGMGIEYEVSPSLGIANSNKFLTAGVGFKYNSQTGLDISTEIGFKKEVNKTDLSYGFNLGFSGLNSRQGLKQVTLSPRFMETSNAHINSVVDNASVVSFGKSTYFPTPSLPLENVSASLNVTLGPEVAFLHPNFRAYGYFNKQALKKKSVSQPAFGYLNSYYAHAEYSFQGGEPVVLGSNTSQNLMDFNRERGPSTFTPDIPNLPLAFGTYDLFNIDAQGLSGQFHAKRNDVGIYGDPTHSNNGVSGNLGVELGAGFTFHGGADINVAISKSQSNIWTKNNRFSSVAKFTDTEGLYEPAYFKDMADRSIFDESFFTLTGSDYPVYTGIRKMLTEVEAEKKWIKEKGGRNHGTLPINNVIQKNERENRNQLISYLSNQEASLFGLEKYIYSYSNASVNVPSPYCSDPDSIRTKITRTAYPGHHMSEITITKPDGSRYVYGLPAYNLIQKEVTFNVNHAGATNTSGLVEYDESDNSTNNSKGKDKFFEARTLPAYSHSFLLTGIVSPDYVDYTGDGISDDDAGTSIKFNYHKPDTNYRWRTPYDRDTARHQEGLYAVDHDDKGSYLYGEKELWYMHSIESKNTVARFYTSAREDGLGVTDEDGGKDSDVVQYQLDSIGIFSKSDLIANSTGAVPIKTVHFSYEYELCPGIRNHMVGGEGKLTLKEVWFTYGKNRKGRTNPYKFTYQNTYSDEFDTPQTFSYDIKNYDRWGNFKINPSGYPSNNVFPYALQDSVMVNRYATAWNLTQIQLPSGGKINIEYEADDYAYVQDKRAGQMMFIKGFASDDDQTIGSTTSDLYSGSTIHKFMYVDLPEPVTDLSDFQKRYLEGIDRIYFNCFVDLTGGNKYEYIQGYAEYEKGNITLKNISDGKYTQAVIPLNIINGDRGKDVHPVSKAAFQLMRLEIPELTFPAVNTGGDIAKLVRGLAGFIGEIDVIVNGFDKEGMSKGWGKKINCNNQSWIRLCNPSYKKYGGGARVKKLTLADNWSNMVAGHSSSEYGQEYFYTKDVTINGDVKTISSGVASYEPELGNEENLFKVPLTYTEKALLGPKNLFYTEKPFGEALFPAPVVGYSEVRMRNIQHENVTRTATGYSLYTFYTAKDFPTVTDFTHLKAEPFKNRPIPAFFGLKMISRLALSQGFLVETNDMHGKPKAEKVFNEKGSMISSVEYRYKVDDEAGIPLHLNNEADIMDTSGQVTQGMMGVDMDVWQDMREESTVTKGLGAAVGIDVIWPFFGLIVGPSFIAIAQVDDASFRSSVTTKHIHRQGLLQEVIRTENGSSISTGNLVYDSETGEVLLTRMQNEFDDPVYQFTYPAHWAYERMGLGSHNVGAIFHNVVVNNGEITNLSGISNALNIGDEVAVYPDTFLGIPLEDKYFVHKISSTYYLSDEDGELLTIPGVEHSGTLKILRSGRRNQAGTPIGQCMTLEHPVNSSTSTLDIDSDSRVIDASAVTFSEDWKISRVRERKECIYEDSIYRMEESDERNDFMDALVEVDSWYITADQGWTLCSLMKAWNPSFDCNTTFLTDLPPDEVPFYSLTPANPYNVHYAYQLRFGDCTLSFQDEELFNLTELDWDGTNLDDTASNVYNIPITIKCERCESICNVDPSAYRRAGDTINIFFEGLAGNWRPYKSLAFGGYENMIRSNNATDSTLNKNGIFTEFHPYWVYSGGSFQPTSSYGDRWVEANTVTLYDRNGNEIENKDVLGRYSAAQYGYKRTRAIAVAPNSKLNQMAFEGYEDYYFSDECNEQCEERHFLLPSVETVGATLDKEKAHTGKYSLKLSSAGIIYRFFRAASSSPPSYELSGSKYTLTSDAFIPVFYPFSPDTGEYIVSAWGQVITEGCSYDDVFIIVNVNDDDLTTEILHFNASGPIIEGWQRVYGKFKIKSTSKSISILLGKGDSTTYYDDIRIHPLHSNMRSYVYDPESMRLMAELDENNYATFYEYNDAGHLVRVKRETERGIMTLREGRSDLVDDND